MASKTKQRGGGDAASLVALVVGLALAQAFLMRPAVSAEESFPAKSIKFVSPFIAGSVTDTVARILADRMKTGLGVSIIVENKPGASTMLGTEYVVNAAPDGYTWVVSTSILPPLKSLQLGGSLRFDPVADLAHVGLICRSFNFLVVPKSLPVNSVKEFVDLAKSQPGRLTYGHAGPGSSPHLGFELFKQAAAIDVLAVPYQAAVQLVPDLSRGEISAMMMPAQVVIATHPSGNIKVLAAIAANRSALFPSVPTIAQAGYPRAEASSWYGLSLPAKTPRPIQQRISSELEKAVASADVGKALQPVACTPESLPFSKFETMIRSETDLWTKVLGKTASK